MVLPEFWTEIVPPSETLDAEGGMEFGRGTACAPRPAGLADFKALPRSWGFDFLLFYPEGRIDLLL